MAYPATLVSLAVLLTAVFVFGDNSPEANTVAKLILVLFAGITVFTFLRFRTFVR
jgi:hypothetical protein